MNHSTEQYPRPHVPWTFDELQSAHVAAGLGGADREFLSICLGIFDDATLFGRIKSIVGRMRPAANEVTHAARRYGISIPDLDVEVRSAADRWRLDEGLTDDHLRATLWIRLRSALETDPATTQSVRGCERLADDLVAAAMARPPDDLLKRARQGVSETKRRWTNKLRGSSADPSESAEDEEPKTLGRVVGPLLTVMVANAVGEKSNLSQEDQERFVAETAARLGEDERQAILREIGGGDFDQALRKWLAAGGAYGALGGAVAVSGFAPYILAAQASAFIPLVSGPALVSLLAVLANPVFIIATVGVVGYRMGLSATQQAARQVATFVISLLACDGIGRSRSSVERLVASFGTVPELPDDAFGSRRDRARYVSRWREFGSGSRHPGASGRPALADDWEHTDIKRDSVGIGALSVGDLLYSFAAIDPHVVAAADFATTEEIANSFDFAVNLLGRMGDEWLGRESLDGMVDRDKGFLMEQLAATKLAADGHVVELPGSSNQPGWDLMVDGQRFQVKCLADSGGLAEHFEKYPEIPVLANSELASDYDTWPAEWKGNVFFLEGHTNELLSQITKRTYSEAKDLGDNDVPEIALAYVAARQVWKLKDGEITASQAASQLLIEGSARVGLAVAGGVVGTSVGLLVLGPAGALVGGALVPILAQAGTGRLTSLVREALGLRSEADAEIDRKCHSLLEAVRNALDEKLATLRVKYRRVGGGVAGTYVRHRLADEGRHLRECEDELVRLADGERGGVGRAVSILRVAPRSVHPSRYQPQLRDLLDPLQVNLHSGGR